MATPRICSITDCGKPHQAHGYCASHYARLRKYGDPLKGSYYQGQCRPLCFIENCGKPVIALGYCERHYRRLRRHGDPLAGGTPAGEPTRFLEEVVLPFNRDECLIWPYAKNSDGYGNIYFEGRHYRVPRLVCENTHGAPPSPEYEAAHSCGKGHLGCCSPRHLSWKTPSENQADKLSHGTHNRGERHNMAKLTDQQVREIRALNGSLSRAQLAKAYGVSVRNIRFIVERKTWTHIA